MVKNMQGLSRKTSTQSFHNHINSPPPTFDFPLHLKENVERAKAKRAKEFPEQAKSLAESVSPTQTPHTGNSARQSDTPTVQITQR